MINTWKLAITRVHSCGGLKFFTEYLDTRTKAPKKLKTLSDFRICIFITLSENYYIRSSLLPILLDVTSANNNQGIAQQAEILVFKIISLFLGYTFLQASEYL